ncbi:MAG: hypothetical protein K9M54_11360 [Kiritimatiellales bacterium]|nr:hypothetical protein [Kiritimatiellales bacterium]MCF7863350.1 hypothetical protein [Kiritimatiellales bacterium]
MKVRVLQVLIGVGFVVGAWASSVTIDKFLVLDPANPSTSLKQYNGNTVVYDGFYLSALSNGINNARISTDSSKNWGAGVGVDTLSFSRSINNNGTTSEAIELYVSADAAKGAYGGLSSLAVVGGTSTVVIEGFASDPQASSANGSVNYVSGKVMWTQASSGGTIAFSNAAASPIGTTLRFSNGSTVGTANQFGLAAFSYISTSPVPGKASIAVLDPSSAEVAWYGERGENYRMENTGNLSGVWSNTFGRIKGTGDTSAVTTSTVTATAFFRVVPDDTGMIFGANVNQFGEALEVPLLEQSRSEWVRVFFPIKKFLNGSRDLANDADLEAVKVAVLSGRKLLLCLKLNFDDGTYRVPEPDTPYEAECFQWVDDLMSALDGLVSVLETVNEVMIDTYPDDLLPGTNGVIPMVQFLQRLVAHVAALGYTTPEGDPLPLYSGGFTRLYDANMQVRPAVPALLAWVNSDSRLTGVNFHIHAQEFSYFQDSYDFLRQAIPSKPAIVTEFSLVWKYKQNLNKPFSTWPTGSDFANLYGYGTSMIVRDYINLAITNTVSETEWNAFLEAMPWYDTHFLGSACEVMQSNGTAIATFAFQQASSGGTVLGPDDTPWILNPIFANFVATNGLPSAAVNQGFFDDYLSW